MTRNFKIKNKLLVCLTGNINTGKSTVLSIFKELGAIAISSDKIVRDLLENEESVKIAMENLFGHDIISSEGKIKREEIAKIVFNDNAMLQKLNALIHPLVFDTAIRLANEVEDNKIILWEVPLLFETKSENKCDFSLVLITKDENAIARISQERKISPDDFYRRKKHQMDPTEQKSLADFVIYNDNSLDELKIKCGEIFTVLQERLNRI